jgi:hypothetical protein
LALLHKAIMAAQTVTFLAVAVAVKLPWDKKAA